jgi:hypothetical protein
MENLETKLVNDRWVTEEQLALAKIESEKMDKTIWSALIKLGFMSEKKIALFFSQESGIPFVKISDYKINPHVLARLEENFCIQNCVIPLFKIQHTLFVACSNPLNTALIDSIAKKSGCVIEPLIADAHSILGALDLYWHLDDKLFEVEKFIVKQAPVGGLSLWRSAKRLPLKVPIIVKLGREDDITSSSSILGSSRDISEDGNALGIEVSLFLPKGLKIYLEFNVGQYTEGLAKTVEAYGEIVQSRMERNKIYFLGIRLLDIPDSLRTQLLKLASC